jgi:hypothetical protein
MPEQTTATDATSEADATSAAEHDDDSSSEQHDESTTPGEDLGEGGKRALEAMRLELKRANARADALESEKREREDAERSDLERVTHERDDLQKRVATLEHEGRARSAAAEAGIPDLWDRLRGDSADELAEDAKAMAERFGQRQTARDLGAGARESSAPAKGNAAMNERIRRAAGH